MVFYLTLNPALLMFSLPCLIIIIITTTIISSNAFLPPLASLRAPHRALRLPPSPAFTPVTPRYSSPSDDNESDDPILDPLLKMSNDALKEELLQRGVKGASGGKVRGGRDARRARRGGNADEKRVGQISRALQRER